MSRLLLALLIASCALLGACNGGPDRIERGDAPAFLESAALYNDQVELLARVRADAVIRIRYTDDDGKRRTEQGEGLLQVVRPDRLALSVNKVGQRLFWFGCDGSRYWWFDLTGDERLGAFGLHERFEENAVGLGIHPLDLVQLLGITPLDIAHPGRTQWSEDGRQLGVTTRTADAGYLRIWLDPERYWAQEVELFDAERNLVARSLLSRHLGVDIAGRGGYRPRMPGRILVEDPSSGAELRLTLYAPRDSVIADEAFDLRTLVETLRPDRVVDLDAAAPPGE